MLSSFRRFASAPVISKYSRSCRAYSGLLSGINSVQEIKHSKFYAASLNIDETADFMRKNKFLYEAAKRDVANPTKENVDTYINGVMEKAEAFTLKDEVWDREEIKELLQSVFPMKGQFVCLLGGKSTGKSLLLKEMNTKSSNLTSLVDMRSGVPLMKALVNEIRKSQKLKDLFESKHIILGDDFFQRLVVITQQPNKSDLEIFNDSIDYIVKCEGRVTIIIDEANIAFDLSHSSLSEINAMQRYLALFVKLTKETHAVNVVLTSTDHMFPYKLEALRFKTADFTEFFFMGEVPPDKMYQLLTEVWGMGENLAIAFMEFYGGHVYDCSKTMNRLAREKEEFEADAVYMGSDEGIVHTLLKFRGTEHEKTAKKYLSALATHGFLSTPDGLDDTVAQYLREKNVAGMVRKNCVAVGLPETVWTGDGDDVFGMIPEKQSTRMIIARSHNKLK